MDETEDMLDLSYSECSLSEITKSSISPQNRIRASQAERGSGQGKRLRRSAAAVAMTVPAEHGGHHLGEGLDVARGHHPAHHDGDVVSDQGGQLAEQLGHQGQVAGRGTASLRPGRLSVSASPAIWRRSGCGGGCVALVLFSIHLTRGEHVLLGQPGLIRYIIHLIQLIPPVFHYLLCVLVR